MEPTGDDRIHGTPPQLAEPVVCPPPPLRSRRHRVHAVLLGLLVVAVSAVPAIAFLLAHAQYSQSEAERQAELARRHQVSAVLQQDIGGVDSLLPLGSGGTSVDARVSWTQADGSLRTAVAPVPAPGSSGETTTVWLDEAGNPVEEPAPPSRAVLDAAAVAVAALLCGGAAVLILYATEQKLFMRSRQRAWTRDWDRIGPTWTAAA
ncbi:MAG TPA: hypothetical protein VLH10_01450 [Yinghuangia sp.]|uniref:Rv1733c family protein n=1 Tax=Yinghuangia sp. YIM S10712 TaxID=3436930 RepID=UPI002CE8A458|nr:hypothetical protein [Yinghuangia sp.]